MRPERFKGVPEGVVNDVRSGWRALVRDQGGVDPTARVAQTTISQVSVYGSTTGDSLPSLCQVLAVEMDLGPGHAHVTEALARATGHILLPIRPLVGGELATHLAKVGAETGEVFARYAAALADDGRIDAAERAAIARELQDVMHAAQAALAHLHAAAVPVPVAARDAA